MVSNGAAIATPIVVAIFLTLWICMCYYADSHPVHKRAPKLPYEVSGGAFEARDGGRQLMPVPERRPLPAEGEGGASASIPTQRAAPGATASTRDADATAEADDTTSPHLVPGSAIRLIPRRLPAAALGAQRRPVGR